MNLLGKISASGKKKNSYPWYSHRYVGRLLFVAICVFIFEYYQHTKARNFDSIIQSQQLKVAYIKSPDVIFESSLKPYGLQYDIIKKYADLHELEIELIQTNLNDALVGLNSNQFDILLGNFASKTEQDSHVFSEKVSQSFLKNFLTHKDIANDWKPYAETAAWLSSDAVITEYKQSLTPKTQIIPAESIIYSESGYPNHLDIFDDFPLAIYPENNLLEALSNNIVQFSASTYSQFKINQKYHAKIRLVEIFSEPIDLVWLLPKKHSRSLVESINTFLNNDQTQVFIKQRLSYWQQPYKFIEFLDIVNLNNKIDTVFPNLKSIFESAADSEDMDWTLLAALAFQESKWSLNAVSPTKVRGIMQLTQATANALDVQNRTDPFESIHGAARYLKSLEKIIPQRVKREDRIWFAVAAYNLGIGKIMKAYQSIKFNKNEIDWNLLATELSQRSSYYSNNDFSTGKNAVAYTGRIKEFQQVLHYFSQSDPSS